MSSSNKKQIFLWYGENDFDIRQQIRQWRQVFEKKYTGLNIVNLDAGGSELSKDKLLAAVKNSLSVDSLFGVNKLIVLENFLAVKNEQMSELLLTALEKLSASFFVVFWQMDKPDARTKLYKLIMKLQDRGSAEIKEFKLPAGYQLGQWIAMRVKHYQAQIEPRAAELLLALTGNNLWQLDSEIAKLVNYSNRGVIKIQDVKLLVKARFNDDIFELMDALSVKNKARAIELMTDQLNSGASEMYIFSMLVRQFRILRQIKELHDVDHLRDQRAIAAQLKLHPFVVKKTIPQISRFNAVELKIIYQKLIELEFELKTRNTGFELLFDKFVAEMEIRG